MVPAQIREPAERIWNRGYRCDREKAPAVVKDVDPSQTIGFSGVGQDGVLKKMVEVGKLVESDPDVRVGVKGHKRPRC